MPITKQQRPPDAAAAPPTATATIELALDMVVLRQQLIDGTAALRGMTIAPFDA